MDVGVAALEQRDHQVTDIHREAVLASSGKYADAFGPEVLVGGVRIGRGAEMQADLLAAGIQIASHDKEESLRLAELRAASGLKLPDCCVLDTAISNAASLAITG